MALQKRSSSSSSLFSLPTSHKMVGQKGKFMTSHYDSPATSDVENSSTTKSSRAARALINRYRSVSVQNTYRMSPDKTMNEGKVRQIIQRNLQILEKEKYDPKYSRDLSKSLSNGILQELKMLGLARYKFVCTVTIGQLRGQTIRVASRCVWDREFDSFVSESFKNKTLFAVATVYGVYHE